MPPKKGAKGMKSKKDLEVDDSSQLALRPKLAKHDLRLKLLLAAGPCVRRRQAANQSSVEQTSATEKEKTRAGKKAKMEDEDKEVE